MLNNGFHLTTYRSVRRESRRQHGGEVKPEPIGVDSLAKKKQGVDMKDAVWVLAMGSQLGLSIALPVLIGLAVGYWIDTRLGTLPWVTLLLTLVGTIIGPIIAYRWVVYTIRKRFEEGKESG